LKTKKNGRENNGQRELHPSSSREKLVIGGIESFQVTIFIRLFFTGFECEKGTVGMVLADIGNTEPE
jgi:hypothetical protein